MVDERESRRVVGRGCSCGTEEALCEAEVPRVGACAEGDDLAGWLDGSYVSEGSEK